MPVLPTAPGRPSRAVHITSKWLSLFYDSFCSAHNLFQA